MNTTFSTAINSRLAIAGVEFSFAHVDHACHLLDEDGNSVVKLDYDFVDVLAELVEKSPLDGNVAAILRQVYLTHVTSNERGHKAGVRFGRAESVRQVHEILGINRIVESFADIRSEIAALVAAKIGG